MKPLLGEDLIQLFYKGSGMKGDATRWPFNEAFSLVLSNGSGSRYDRFSRLEMLRVELSRAIHGDSGSEETTKKETTRENRDKF